jgi:hypothetical protein
MSYPIYTGYTIWFTDPAEYAIALLITGGTTFYINPVDAATIFGITYPATTLGTYPPESDWNESTLGQSGIFSNDFSLQLPGSNVFNPIDSGIPLPPNVDSVLVPDTAGNPPIFVGSVAEVIWYGRLLYCPFHPTGTTLPQRRWIGGIEIAGSGEGTGFQFSAGCRDASRTSEGIGASYRGANGPGVWLRSFSDYGIANPSTSWERFYVRLRVSPSSGPHVIWRSAGSINTNIGFVVSINNSGQLVFSQSNSVGTLVTIATYALNLGVWHQIDVLFGYYSGGGSGTVSYQGRVNKTVVASGSSVVMVPQTHTSSSWGKGGAGDATLQLDMDDWICMDFNPYNDQGAYFGSHVRVYKNESIVSAVGWTSNVNLTNQGHNANQSQNALSTSVTANARIQARTFFPVLQREPGYVTLGECSAEVSSYSSNTGGTDGKLGVDIATGFITQNTTIDQTIAAAFNVVVVRPFGLTAPFYFGNGTGLLVNHDKSNDANTDNMRSLTVLVEEIGIWNACDDYSGTFIEPAIIRHNAYFPNTPWAIGGGHIPPPVCPVFAVGGTYVGNGTETIVTLPAPFQFLWVRALTGGASGIKWFGCGLGGHLGVVDSIIPGCIDRAWYDDTTKQAKFAVCGTDPECNAAGVTYQYIAFCDPGMRFNLCGSYHALSGIAMPISLPDGNFTGTWAFNQADKPGLASGVTGLSCTGPGFTAGAGQTLDGNAVASFGVMTAGQFLVGSSSAIASNSQSNYSLWRPRDFTCGYVMIQTVSYVGNGSNPRNITLTPTSGRFPLFVIVTPHSGGPSFMRDPSHAGANSCSVNSLTNSASAITAVAIDQITVQSTLNTNLVIYDVFVICGSNAGMLNGTYYPPGCVPSFGPSGPWDIPPVDPADIAIIGEGGIELGAAAATSQLSLLRDISGIYTIVDGKTSDTLYDRQPAQTSADHAIPNPFFETGFIGG